MIRVEREPPDAAVGGVYEVCHFCQVKTVYWHRRTNNPVCPICAPLRKVSELPDHGQRIRAADRKRKAASEVKG